MSEQKISGLAKFARFALGYNILVILWGVFLRASYSGDACGQHWLTCGGEAVPTAPQLKTLIEFSHRITTALGGLVVFVLLVWAFASKPRHRFVRLFALLSFIFISIEGAIGGGLVLTGNTAANWTPARPYWTAGHLINTFILVAALTLTAWAATRKREFIQVVPRSAWLLAAAGTVAIFFIGVTGSMAALTTMLFPAASIGEGLQMDFDPSSHPLLRLRILHPIAAIGVGVGLLFVAGWAKANASNDRVRRNSNILSILVMVQLAFGAATLLTLGPIALQLGHLLLADFVWISFVLMFANQFTSAELD